LEPESGAEIGARTLAEQRAIGVAGQRCEAVGHCEAVGRCGEGSSEGGGDQIAERGMGDAFVVARAPTRQRISGLAEIVEDRLIEQFVAHSAIERFPDPLRIGLPGAMKC
jgi:hypothetical protein